MKKFVLLLAVAFVTVISAQAQVSVGLRAGANYSGFAGEGGKDTDMIFGWHAGITTNFAIVEDFFAIQPEILYSRKGAENKNDDQKWQINYVDIPVLGKVNAGPLYFELGPQFSVRAGGDAGTRNSEDFKRTAFGYAAGLGLSATAIGASIGVRYTSDFSKLYENSANPNIRNNVFMLTLGFAMPGRR